MRFSTLVVAVLSVASYADAKWFTRTCKSWKVTGTNNVVLRGCCLDARGYYKISEVHLKHCLANIGGLIKKREGNFHQSCENCRVQSKPGSIFTCRCYIESEDWDWYDTSFNKLVSVCDWGHLSRNLELG